MDDKNIDRLIRKLKNGTLKASDLEELKKENRIYLEEGKGYSVSKLREILSGKKTPGWGLAMESEIGEQRPGLECGRLGQRLTIVVDVQRAQQKQPQGRHWRPSWNWIAELHTL